MQGLIIRSAMPEDAAFISQVLGGFASKEILLPRQEDEILENIRDFQIAVIAGEPVGCCALKIYTKDLAEIRSLAVDTNKQSKGAGKKLIQVCEEDARIYKIKKVFALTYIPDFFKKNGYEVTEKESLPQKIWRDCFKCHKFPNCNETAVIKKM